MTLVTLKVCAVKSVNSWWRLEVQHSYFLAVGAQDSYTLAHTYNPSSLERLLQGALVVGLSPQGVDSGLTAIGYRKPYRIVCLELEFESQGVVLTRLLRTEVDVRTNSNLGVQVCAGCRRFSLLLFA